MRRYLILTTVLLAFFLLLFVAAEAANVPLLVDPSPWLKDGGWGAGAVGVLLLTVDVFLPVPSSVVMVAHGALFGVWVGTLLSWLGSVGAFLVGFGIGRSGNRAIRRFVTPAEHERAGRLLERWGPLAIVASRPLPLLAETVAILAGASPMGWGRAGVAAALGAVPAAFLYALAGATAARTEMGLLVFGVVLLLSGVVWWLGRRGNTSRDGD